MTEDQTLEAKLHRTLLLTLIGMLEDNPTHEWAREARQFLKDNQVAVPGAGSSQDLARLSATLAEKAPFPKLAESV